MGREIEIKIPVTDAEYQKIYSVISGDEKLPGVKICKHGDVPCPVEHIIKSDFYFSRYETREESKAAGEPQVIRIRSEKKPLSLKKIETAVYPGIPTDLQAQLMALQCVSQGSCMIVENVFESRYKHVPELLKMGADITLKDRVAIVRGVESLSGAEVYGKDLRGTAALVLAGLCAKGYTTVFDIHHVDRGYESIENDLSRLGADIKRVEY